MNRRPTPPATTAQQGANRRAPHAAAPAFLSTVSTVLFMSSALLASRVAYDPAAAHAKLALLSAGLASCLVFAALARWRAHTAFLVGSLVCGLAVWSIVVGGVVMRDGDPAAAAGALVVLIPLAGCGLRPVVRRRVDGLTVYAGLSMAVGCLVLVATKEWSAIAALAGASILGAWAWWRHGDVTHRRKVGLADALVVALLGAGAVLYLSLLFSHDLTTKLSVRLGPDLLARPELWQDVRALIGDYRFTGSGLAGSAMVMSSYLFLLHVPYHPHAHNLFLQVALEQGIPGLVGLLGMFVAAGWSVTSALRRGDADTRWRAVTVAVALVGLGLYGLVESDLHDSNLAFCLLLPFGFAWALGGRRSRAATRSRARTWPGRYSLLVGLIPLGLVAAMAAWPGARAMLQANIGAVLQTRAELPVYQWPRWSIQDRLRREQVVDLDPAMEHYRSALALDRSNVTALRRLGQIELSVGHYPEAVAHLQRALVGAPDQRVTRRLLAEALAVTGKVTAAATLWAAVRTTRKDLEPRLWWYRYIGADPQVERLQEAIGLLERSGRDPKPGT